MTGLGGARSQLAGLLALVVILAACGGAAPRHPAPGAPTPVPMVDTLPIVEPAARETGEEIAQLLDESINDELGHIFSVSRPVSGTPASRNVTPFDDVVPSAWFEPRIGGPGLSPRETAHGPPGPDPIGPFTVVDVKVEGVTPGLTMTDAGGRTWVVKFDPPEMTGLTSGPDVVTSRIFWAAGYHAPRNVVVELEPEALAVGEDATVEDAGGERPLGRRDVTDALRGVDRGSGGRIRALASLFLEGVPKGPFAFEGRRPDDPNDHYPHEDRRELRGMWVLAAWTNHVDLRWRNTLDMWHERPGYLKHHLIDFGTSLGSGGIRPLNPREGREYALDIGASLARLVTVGLYRVGWEGTVGTPIHPALGWLPVEEFDAGAWKPFYPNEPFRRLTPSDGYWGAKLVAAFTREHVRAIVAEARYPKEAGDTLVDILLERRLRTVRHWYGRVTPVEDVEVRVDGDALVIAFRDLGLEERIWSPRETAYRWRAAEFEGVSQAAEAGRQQVRIPLAEELLRALDRARLHDPVRLELRAERASANEDVREAHVRLYTTEAGRIVVAGVLH